VLSTKRYYDSQIYAVCGGGALLPSGGCVWLTRGNHKNHWLASELSNLPSPAIDSVQPRPQAHGRRPGPC
jgi:hypothetical protein